jgi:phosphoenolpyruvate phosphomutase
MKEVAKTILMSKRSLEADSLCCPVSEIFDKVGFSDVKNRDLEYTKARVGVIIPAAGRDSEFPGIPKAMLNIKGKPVLQRQVDILKKIGLSDITVIRGYEKDKFTVQGIKYIDNDEYEKHFLMNSIFKAEDKMSHGFVCINSDVLFKEEIIKRLIESKDDIVLVVDNSYEYHKHNVEKGLDLVMVKHKPSKSMRVWEERENNVMRIGKTISKEMADFEYIGIAYFSDYGAEILKKVYYDCMASAKGPFHEAPDFERAGFTDIIQQIIELGFKVKILEVHKGWMEIHNKKDYEDANKISL